MLPAATGLRSIRSSPIWNMVPCRCRKPDRARCWSGCGWPRSIRPISISSRANTASPRLRASLRDSRASATLSMARGSMPAGSRASGWPSSAGVRGSGAWAEYIVVPAAMCVVVKSAMRDEDAAGHVVNPVTAWTMFDIVKQSGAKSFVFTAAFSQLGKLMAGLARDNGHAMIAVIRKGEPGQASQGTWRQACADPVRSGLRLQACGALQGREAADPARCGGGPALGRHLHGHAQSRPLDHLWQACHRCADDQRAGPVSSSWTRRSKASGSVNGSGGLRSSRRCGRCARCRPVSFRGAWKTEVVATVKLGDADGQTARGAEARRRQGDDRAMRQENGGIFF